LVNVDQEENMQAAARKLSRWATVGAVAALLAGLAGTAQARPWHHWGWGHYWGPRVAVAPYYNYNPYYYSPYYRPYYAPPPAVYGPPVASYYPEPTYYPYAAPGASFNFTVPLR
jgi:hypothetical protein